MGLNVGAAVGEADGLEDGLVEGTEVGPKVGLAAGEEVGLDVATGLFEGALVGCLIGELVGLEADGVPRPSITDCTVGCSVAWSIAEFAVSDFVGLSVSGFIVKVGRSITELCMSAAGFAIGCLVG